MFVRLVLVIVALAWTTQTARAEEGDARAQARALLRDGNEKLDQGLYLEALDRYERAYELFPSPRLHFNIAQALNELGRTVDALAHYERYVREVTEKESPELWRLAHERIFRLEGVVARVEIQASVADAEVSVDGKSVGKTPLAAPILLMPGPHAIVVARPGYQRHVIERTLRPGETVIERIELHTEEEAAAARRAVEQAEVRRRAAEEQLRRAEEAARSRREGTRRTWRTTGWTALGVGIASIATAGVLAAVGSGAAERVSEASAGTPWANVRDDYDRASSLRAGAIATAVAGGVLVVGGAALLGITAPREGRVALSPMLVPGATGLAAAGSF